MKDIIKAPEGYKYVVVDDTTIKLKRIKPEMEYLDSNGDWISEDILSSSSHDYKVGLNKLDYNFGHSKYLVSKTDLGYDVIWRLKE